MSGWRWMVELESGVWLAPWDGDPGRTLIRDHAKRFASHLLAIEALENAREFRSFSAAIVHPDDLSE